MDLSRVPIPPAHYTPEEKERFLLDHIKKAMSVSTTRDESQAQTEKDSQHEVNQPLPAEKDTELPMVAHTETEAALSKRDEVTSDAPPPAPILATSPSPSVKDVPPKEKDTSTRPSSSKVHSSGSMSGESEARDVLKELPSQGTQQGIYIQGTVSTSKSLTPKVPTTQESVTDLDVDLDACLADNPLLHTTPGALSASKGKGVKLPPPAPPAQIHLSDDDEPGDGSFSQSDETESDDEPKIIVHQKGKRKGKAVVKPPPSKRPKVELKLQEPAEVKPKRGKSAPKVPFSDIRPLIHPLIFNEDQVRSYTFSEDEDLEIRKAWSMLNFQGLFTLVPEPSRACTSLVRDFYKNLNVISSKNPAQLYSSACQLWWRNRDVFITLHDFTTILQLPTDEEGPRGIS